MMERCGEAAEVGVPGSPLPHHLPRERRTGDLHGLELARYILLNPVRAGLVRNPGRWRWSSYRATAGYEQPPFLEVGWVLSQFDPRPERARRAYRRFVAQGKGVEIWGELKGGVILRRDEFVGELKAMLKGKRTEGEIPPKAGLVHRPGLEDLFGDVKGREDWDERIYQAVVEYGYRLREVGEYLGLHYSTVSRIVGRRKSKAKVKT